MLCKNSKAFCSFSVNDLDKAKKFHGETLGLEVKETPEGLELHLAGGTMPVFIYPSDDYHAPEPTVLNFIVDDIDEAMDYLKKRVEHRQKERPPSSLRIGVGPGETTILEFLLIDRDEVTASYITDCPCCDRGTITTDLRLTGAGDLAEPAYAPALCEGCESLLDSEIAEGVTKGKKIGRPIFAQ